MPALHLELTANHFDLRSTKSLFIFLLQKWSLPFAYLQLMLKIEIIILEINSFGLNFSWPPIKKETPLVGEEYGKFSNIINLIQISGNCVKSFFF